MRKYHEDGSFLFWLELRGSNTIFSTLESQKMCGETTVQGEKEEEDMEGQDKWKKTVHQKDSK